MSIQNKIQVNTHYTRSINLERDADSTSVVEAYIPTTRALQTLDSMDVALKADESPRAWSLVGPYGSGKSSFAVFLAHLLSDPKEPATEAALKKLGSEERGLGSKYRNLTRNTAGYCTVLLTGGPESFGRRLVQALAEKSHALLHGRYKVIHELSDLAEHKDPPTSTEIINAIKEFQDALASKYSGLLIVVDELGKFLEYEARHYGANDIFLLQALAEHALANHTVKLSLVVMLHQAFEQYARGLGESLRNEWAKVQGRFENIPFLESAEQTLRIVGAAIQHDFNKTETTKILGAAKKMAGVLYQAQAIPSTMDEATAVDLFTRCYPLHPVSALLLPILCQKIAQNERTLFSYLGSRETHGFQDSMSHCEKIGEWIYPWEIYEYFVLNQSAALSDHFTHRRWAEVVTATERLGDAHDNETRILKAIGLLNIIGAQGNFKASNNIIELCLPTKAAAKRATKELTEKSIIQYRKFSAEYRVWQGSDFDLEANVEAELEKIGRFELAESLNNRHNLMPIVARKYSIESGALRYFHPTFIDSQTLPHLDENDACARIVFYLAESKGDEDTFREKVLDSKAKLDIRVLCPNSDQLREAVAEVLALETIQKTSQELNSDPVAQRELKDRYNAAIGKEEDLLDRLTAEPQRNHWHWKIEKLTIDSKRSLQKALSYVLEKVYNKSPIFQNELINREKPSSQANAAKNKLAIAMFNHEAEADLGIDKFPAEKAIYRACLRKTKLHVQTNDGDWKFQGPQSARKSDDPCNLYPVWQRIDAFLDSTEQQAKSLVELNLELMAPPYGIKQGMLPILYLAVLMANQQELAIYEGRIYTPYLSEEQIERFLKRPDEFTVQKFSNNTEAIRIYNVYRPVFSGESKQQGIPAIAHLLSNKINTLPLFTKYTIDGVSKEATAVRDAILEVEDLRELFLVTLPETFSVKEQNTIGSDSDEEKKFQNGLKAVITELDYFIKKVRADLVTKISIAFDYRSSLSPLELRSELKRFSGLDSFLGRGDYVGGFVRSLENDALDTEIWFDALFTLIGQKPLEKWSDGTILVVEKRIKDIAKKLLTLEAHHFGSLPASSSGADVYVLELVTKNRQSFSRTVSVTDSMRAELAPIKGKLRRALYDGSEEHDDRLAALVEIINELPNELTGRDHEMA